MTKSEKPKQHWLLWWVIDPAELNTEITKYPSRSIFKTARGVSAACLLLSVVITLGLAALKMIPADAIFDAVISLVLALFVYLGHRWAMLAAMAWWTLEKVTSLFGGLSIATGGLVVTQVIWWCVYMHAFWLAFRVEQARRKQIQDGGSAQTAE